MKAHKVQRCMNSACRAPLLSAFEREQGFCTKCQSRLSDEEMAAIRGGKSPRVLPKKPKSPVSKKPSSIHKGNEVAQKHVDTKESSIHESNNASCCTRLPEKSAEFMENYADMLGITLSELIRKVLLGWIEAMK